MADHSGDEAGENKEYFDPEEEVKVNWTAKTSLPLVEVKTGEEEDDLIYKTRAKLFRFRNDEWKERGVGDVKLLRNKKTNKIRLVMRQDKTLKIVGNFIIQESPMCELKEHLGSDKSFFFIANDYSEDAAIIEKFVFKFGNAEIAKNFLKSFNEAKEFNLALKNGSKDLKFAPVITEKDIEKKPEEKKVEEVKVEK